MTGSGTIKILSFIPFLRQKYREDKIIFFTFCLFLIILWVPLFVILPFFTLSHSPNLSLLRHEVYFNSFFRKVPSTVNCSLNLLHSLIRYGLRIFLQGLETSLSLHFRDFVLTRTNEFLVVWPVIPISSQSSSFLSSTPLFRFRLYWTLFVVDVTDV